MTEPVTTSDPKLHQKLRVAHLCANLSYAALLILLTLWAFSLGGGFSPILWAMACVPLLILWPGMRKRRHRAYSWLCFVVLFYFVKSVEGSMSSIASWLDYGLLALSVIIFISAMMASRWLQRANLAAAPAATPGGDATAATAGSASVTEEQKDAP